MRLVSKKGVPAGLIEIRGKLLDVFRPSLGRTVLGYIAGVVFLVVGIVLTVKSIAASAALKENLLLAGATLLVVSFVFWYTWHVQRRRVLLFLDGFAVMRSGRVVEEFPWSRITEVRARRRGRGRGRTHGGEPTGMEDHYEIERSDGEVFVVNQGVMMRMGTFARFVMREAKTRGARLVIVELPAYYDD